MNKKRPTFEEKKNRRIAKSGFLDPPKEQAKGCCSTTHSYSGERAKVFEAKHGLPNWEIPNFAIDVS